MNHFPHLKVPMGSGGSSAVPLQIGIYWYDGNAVSDGLTPHEGEGWLSTSRFTDGLAGDITTREDSTGAYISALHVSAGLDLATWNATFKYVGEVTVLFYEWSGAAWSALANTAPAPSTHIVYEDEVDWEGTANGSGVLIAHMIVLQTSNPGGGVMSLSDSRPA